jgi:hypothetical protein
LLIKGSIVDLENVSHFKLTKKKSKLGVLSMIGLGKKNLGRNYIAFFDEHFLYFSKDIEVNQTNKLIRKVGNKYNIKSLQNTFIEVFFLLNLRN